LNQHFSAKKALTLTYMKPKQSNNSIDSNSTATTTSLPPNKPSSSLALEETIMFAIQQAESTLEDVRNGELNPITTAPKFTKTPAAISSYVNKPPGTRIPNGKVDIAKSVNAKGESEPGKKKPVLGKYVLHKLPTMQTTYNTTYTTGNSKL